MADGGNQISALHLAIAATGGVLVYAALQGMTPIEALKELTSGRTPRPVSDTAAIKGRGSRLGGGWGPKRVAPSGTAGTSGSNSALVQAAEKHLGTPYVWGGKKPGGLDCSGLVVVAFQSAYGITPPPSTYGQEVWSKLTRIHKDDLAAGDLVFWPGHVAIYVGNGQVIHAPKPGSHVKFAPLNQAGPVGVNPSSYQRYKPRTLEA